MQDEIDIIDERTERAGLPLLLVTIFFLFEGMRFQSVGTFVLPCVGLMAMVPSLGLLPLRRTSVPQARCIYAWFLLASVVVAYVDYEVMIAHGVWFSDRPQDDPGKYMEMAQTEFEYVRINDPGFVILLQCFWKLQSQLGAPSFIGLVNCVMIISSVFAVCCLELSRFLSPSARYLPYLLIFNPLVIALNASLMRNILVGAVGWSAALCGIALLTHERRSPIVGIGLMVGFLSGCTAVYFLRTVSAAFFAGATVAIAASDGRRLKKMRALAMVGVGMSALVLLGEGLLARSVRHAGDADTVVESARDQGSVAAHVTGGLSRAYCRYGRR